VGLLAVMGFMLVYYRGSGVNADLALVLNLLILIAALVDLKLFAILAVGVLVAWVVSPIAGAIIAAVGLLVTFAVGAPSPGTFTLPGIAGVILTVGMGVDSNVLIFERIREELRLGKAVGAAVAAGFEQAFRTIIDTHVTTIVSAAILFAFGTGPIQGFAVTLTIGLLANLFTSVFVSRVIFDYGLTQREKGAVLSI
jgi:preprotein translocase subunit SecD